MASIFIKTYGCAHNQADSETMAGLLKQAGHTITNDQEQADLLLINSCTVKDSSEKRFLNDLKRTDTLKVLAGCVPQADPNNPELQGYSTVGVANLQAVTEVVDGTLKGKIIRKLDRNNGERVLLPKIRKNPVTDIIPINSGCLGSCTFCKTKQSRGSLYSYPINNIVTQFRLALRENVKEFWLSSEDTGAYGLDHGTSLAGLLEQLLKVQGDYRIRIGMTNPEHVLRDLENLIKVFQHPNVFKFLHLPVQSGSNRVLKLMKREYTKEQFLYIVNAFRKAIPQMAFMTDIICGFPTETEEEFYESLELINTARVNFLNCSKFFSRPNTRAAKLPPLNTKVLKARTLKLTRHFAQLDQKQNKAWLNWTGTALVDEQADGFFTARNDSYMPIVIKSKNLKIGEKIQVRITESRARYLIGSIAK